MPTWFAVTRLSRIHLRGFRYRDRLRRVMLCISDDLDAAVAHLCDEVEMIALGVLDPQNRRQSSRSSQFEGVRLVGAGWRQTGDQPKLANLRMNTEIRGDISRSPSELERNSTRGDSA